ncbi:hypothetical protein PFAG_04201 [Plasmodium falciparum Santa Lucia]|uniref:Uncharacterized protein n=7 Tax=Plasmodium falciparum TaxID=5833 RepID=A0A024W347_PLAFA|nr:hypothetical protein PFFVO_03811 [Plasmodium falciparum Vietnam Oak-Knoll (FVO)]ETW35122.1 hypothetical protein PFTANZ_04170 [Plasmodium falciparum Tanzania (2000708)]ETW41374.1 hypothetical protein PFNF135_04360 [Plasmodium falciparum NF135/5.C10]ETW47884.1 hypothetical protein PFMALIP_04072 [Plasmodium falciparum MaliPS096_E11]ETW59997.1 hypothetical protein PFMC_04173 [Plasmodium falciparum CAMP/Malaysia]EUR67186.1 hypothetical protein PFBG_04262 [Plasmodium falciparum 7G8]EUT82019.1 hy
MFIFLLVILNISVIDLFIVILILFFIYITNCLYLKKSENKDHFIISTNKNMYSRIHIFYFILMYGLL